MGKKHTPASTKRTPSRVGSKRAVPRAVNRVATGPRASFAAGKVAMPTVRYEPSSRDRQFVVEMHKALANARGRAI